MKIKELINKITLSRTTAYIMLVLSTLSLIATSYYAYYVYTFKADKIELSDITRELELPEYLDLTKYNHKDFVVKNVSMEKGKGYFLLNGFYTYNVEGDYGEIYLHDLSKSKVNSTFIHEYSHHLMAIGNEGTPYLSTLSGEELEQATDILAIKLSETKDVKFKPNYISKKDGLKRYNNNNKLKKDIDYLVQFEYTTKKYELIVDNY